MRKNRLGYTDLDLSVIGLGAWAMGGPWKYGWSNQDDGDSISAIHSALDEGINWIDTAHVYGFGHSEEVVGRALEGRREGVIVATKCGMLRESPTSDAPVFSLKRDSVRRECEGSLKRLKIDVIDLYQIHWPNPEAEIEEAWEELIRLKDESKVRHIGVCNFSVAQLERCQKMHPVASLQPPYSMLRRDIEGAQQPWCLGNHCGIVAYSPMQHGLLTGKVTRAWVDALPADDFRRNYSADFREPKLTAHLNLVDGLRAIAAAHGATVGQVAVAWTLRGDRITSAIVGARTPAQVRENARAAEVRLSDGDVAQIEALLEQHAREIASA